MPLEFKIRLINKHNEIEAFRELFERVFNTKMTRNLWEWKYLENPMMPNQPLIYIAEHEKKMVGARSLLPTRMKFENKILNAIQLCDTMVHPNYRRMGLFRKMNRCAIEDARKRGFSLFYGFPTQMLGKIYKTRKSLGWQLVSKKTPSIKIFSPKKVASSQISNKVLGKIAGMALRFLSPYKSKLPSMTPEKSYDITEEKLITEEFQKVWKNFSSNFKICTVRNKEYMEWRFVKHPENDYRFFIARKNKEPFGYFVTGIAENRNLVEGRIIDYIIKDDGGKEVFLSLLLASVSIWFMLEFSNRYIHILCFHVIL